MRRLLGFAAFVLVLSGSVAFGASVMYGLASNNQLYEIDPLTAATTYRSTLHVPGGTFGGVTTLDFVPDGRLFTYSYATRQFGVVTDPLSGVVSLLPASTGSVRITALSFTNDGTMWAVDFYQRRIWTVNPTTGQLMTPRSTSQQYSSLAAYDDGLFYLGQYSGNGFWRFDINTMSEVFVMSLTHGSPLEDICRMDDGVTGQTVAAVTAGRVLEYVDIVTSSSYVNGSYSPYFMGVAYWADQQEIPEPCTMLLLCVGGALTLTLRKRLSA